MACPLAGHGGRAYPVGSESGNMTLEGNDAEDAGPGPDALEDPDGPLSGSSELSNPEEIPSARGENAADGQGPIVKANRTARLIASGLTRDQGSSLGFLGPQVDLADFAKKYAIPFAASAMFEQFRMADLVTPAPLRMAELAGTAWIADMFGSKSAFAGWRQSLVTKQAAIAVAASSVAKHDFMTTAMLGDLTRFTNVGASLAEMAVRFSTAGMFTSVLSQFPTVSLRHYITALPPSPSLHQLTMGARGSHGVAGLVGIDVVTSSTDDRAELEKAIDQIEGGVVEPWLSAPSAVRTEMLDRLREIDGTVPDLLNGAWDDVTRAGPGATVKVATCTTEALERTLRGLAPDTDVLAWLSTGQKRLKDDRDSRGGPTHATRARYVLRDRPGDRKLVVTQVEAVIAQVPELRSRLQASKHASAGTLAALRAHLVSTEAVLVQLTMMI